MGIFNFSTKNKRKKTGLKGVLKNPLFYFGLFSTFLFAFVCFGFEDFSNFNDTLKNKSVFLNSYLEGTDNSTKDSLFLNSKDILALEVPDLKIIDDNCVCGNSSYRVLSTQVLGAIFGEESQNSKEIVEYSVLPGDTFESIAQNFNISLNTILWSNNLTKNSTLKVGQTLIILPVSGLLHIVKSGDTISDIAKTYKAKVDDIVSYNNFNNENDIFIGDILIVPGGVMPPKPVPSNAQAPIANNFFIIPVEGTISQRLHFYNAVDVANKCGTPFYAAASGTVQRVAYGWNLGGGNYITILHPNGVVSYYGHFMTAFVKPGDVVKTGDRIGLVGGGKGMAGAGKSTGCHLHFDIRGGKNPLAGYVYGTKLKFK
jgi:murein DD-endopeptidase MepM/ murein hydrolase activator NlpD